MSAKKGGMANKMKMKKAFFILPVVVFIVGCFNNKDFEAEPVISASSELLKKAYGEKNYQECMRLLNDGADGIVFLEPRYPMLYDIVRQYLDAKLRNDDTWSHGRKTFGTADLKYTHVRVDVFQVFRYHGDGDPTYNRTDGFH
jgi:hypothetical protein